MNSSQSRGYKDLITGLDDTVVALYSPAGLRGHVLVSGTAEGKVRSWNLKDRSKLFKVKLNKGSGKALVTSYLFIGDGVAAGFEDGDIGLFDLRSASLQFLLKGHTGFVNALKVFQNTILSGGQDGAVRRWNMETGKCQSLYQFNEPISAIVVMPEAIIVGSWDKMIRKIDMTSNTVVQSLIVAEEPIKCLALDGTRLYVGGYEPVIRAWDLETLECKQFKGHKSWVLQLRIEGDYLYSCSDDRTIKVWDKHTCRIEEELEAHSDGVTCLEIVNEHLCSGSYDQTIRSWDLSDMFKRIEEKHGMMQCDIEAWRIETYIRLMNAKKKKGKGGKGKKGKKK